MAYVKVRKQEVGNLRIFIGEEVAGATTELVFECIRSGTENADANKALLLLNPPAPEA